MRSILYSFILPKFYSFYLVELKIIFELFKSLFKSIFTKNLLIKIKLDQKLKVYLSSSIILYFFMIVLTLVSLIIHKDPDYFELIFIFKMVIYFILMPLFIERTLSRQFLSNLKIITILFFFLSALIFANSLSSNTISSLLWQADTFGARFVGFTGLSISHNGSELIGSTANAVGILYVFLFSIFAFGQKEIRDYRIALICFFGIALTLSQSAIAAFILLIVASVKIRLKFSVKAFISILIFIIALSTYVYLYKEDSIFFRIFENVDILLSDGVLPGTIYDRYLQWQAVGDYVSNCTASFFVGQSLIFDKACGQIFIAESYFLDIFKKFGFFVLILGVLQFYFMYKLCSQSKIITKSFFIAWLLSNVFFNNTYQTDFILFSVFLIWRASLQNSENTMINSIK